MYLKWSHEYGRVRMRCTVKKDKATGLGHDRPDLASSRAAGIRGNKGIEY